MKRLARFTDEEERAWQHAFAFYLDHGMSDDQADAAAWKDVQEEFPRLKDYDGANPLRKRGANNGHGDSERRCMPMAYIGPISIRDELFNELKAKIREINLLPEDHPIRRRLTPPGRSVVSRNSFACYAIEWLLETLANQNDSPNVLIETEHSSIGPDPENIEKQSESEDEHKDE